MAKKLKKAKKGMSPKAKFTLVNSFKGLISNQAVIDGSKESAWWVAAIFFVFSVLLPLIPNYVSFSKMNGNSFISNLNYGLDEQLSHFVYTQKKNNVEFKVEGGKLHYYQNGNEKSFVDPTLDETYFSERKSEYSYVNSQTDQYDFRVYFWVDENLSINADKVIKQTYLLNGRGPAIGEDGEKVYLPNILIITPTTFAVSLYKANTNTNVATSYGGLDWLNSTTEKGLIERMLGDYAADVEKSENEFVNSHREQVLSVFKDICTETYLNQKTRTKWTNTGIYFAIYGGVILFLGLMVFILTRGKSNPYKFLNIWECQKIAWWGAASPAILGTLLSLIFSGNSIGQMAFILLVSLRVMWLSMKQLRPVIQ